MKNRTDRMLLRIFLVSLLAYGILVFVCVTFGSALNASPATLPVYQTLLWLTVGGHIIPFFALQLLLCRRCEGKAKYLAVQLTAIILFLLGLFAVSAFCTPGWDALGWYFFMTYTIAPAAGCVLAWPVYGLSLLGRKKRTSQR